MKANVMVMAYHGGKIISIVYKSFAARNIGEKRILRNAHQRKARRKKRSVARKNSKASTRGSIAPRRSKKIIMKANRKGENENENGAYGE